jgi:hypothetical protein
MTPHSRPRRHIVRNVLLAATGLVLAACGAASTAAPAATATAPASPAAPAAAKPVTCAQIITADGYSGELKAERTPACRKVSTAELSKLLAHEDQVTNPDG